MSGSSSTIKTRSMPDILAPYQKHDHFSDIRGMIPDPLEVLGDEDQLDRPGDRPRVLEHIREQLTEDLLVQIVHDTVVENDLLGKVGVGVDERIQAFFQDLLR